MGSAGDEACTPHPRLNLEALTVAKGAGQAKNIGSFNLQCERFLGNPQLVAIFSILYSPAARIRGNLSEGECWSIGVYKSSCVLMCVTTSCNALVSQLEASPEHNDNLRRNRCGSRARGFDQVYLVPSQPPIH